MIGYKIIDIINIAIQVVMYSTGERECDRLNSFVIIDDTFNWDTDSFEARAEPEFYFSRNKERLLYPALALSFNTKGLGSYKNNFYNNYCHPIAIGIIDQLQTDCKNCTPCMKRGKERIYIESAELLTKVLNAISNIQLFKVVKDAEISYKWSHQGIIDIMLGESVYDTATVVMGETAIFNDMWERRNDNVSFNELPITKQKTLAVWANINICEP